MTAQNQQAQTPTEAQIEEYVKEQAKAYGVPTAIALATVKKESSFDVNAPGKAGEVGLMQITPVYFGKERKDAQGNKFTVDEKRLGSDWQYNVRVGMSILKQAYRFALRNAPDDVARATYARYNAWGNWKLYQTNPRSDVYKHVVGFYKYYLEYLNQPGR